MGALTSLDISNNNLTQGAVSGYDSDGDPDEYAIDMTGTLQELLYITLLTAVCGLQVLTPLRMLSLA
jgi:hypothetical protein